MYTSAPPCGCSVVL
uniref:Uncharacterized protein n=1 Tax=Anguilla anguilla TaxID=7936 RepID=A0A0E9SYB4_ANGAN